MESAQNDQLTASSSHDYWLNTDHSRLSALRSWSVRESGLVGAWIQIDILRTAHVYKVSTKGRGNGVDQWVTSYQLATSLTGEEADLEYVMSSTDGAVVAFNANSDSDTIVSNSFSPRVVRFVRLYPQAYHGHISLRWEVYGCYFGVTCPFISLDASVNAHSYNILGGSEIQAYCDNDEYFASTNYVRNITANCLNSGNWDINVEQFKCISKTVVTN